MFESYIRGVFYYNYSSCHQLHTVALSFLPYAAGKQQLEGKMPKIGHFHFTNRSQREKIDGMSIDYSFLNCKKELLNYGYKVGKISLKGKTVDFEKV